MASTVTWDGLRDLAGFRTQNGCAISLYLDLDPRVTPTAADVTTRVNALIDEIERSERATPGSSDATRGKGCGATCSGCADFFEQDFERDGAHGLAVFCAGLDNLWQSLPLSSPVPDAVKVGGTSTSRRSSRSSAAERGRWSSSSAASAATSTVCGRGGSKSWSSTTTRRPGATTRPAGRSRATSGTSTSSCTTT